MIDTKTSDLMGRGIESLLIKIGGECIDSNEPENDSMFSHIATLNAFGVFPAISHGAGTQIDSYESITSSKLLTGCVMPANMNTDADIAYNIRRHGGSAVSTVEADLKIVFAKKSADRKLKFVGEPCGADATRIIAYMKLGFSPVIGFVGYDGSQPLNVNADYIPNTIIESMSQAGQPIQRYLIVTKKGGIRLSKGTGDLLPIVDHEDISALVRAGIIEGGMAVKARNAAETLTKYKKYLGYGFTCQIVSPAEIINALIAPENYGTRIVKGKTPAEFVRW